MHFFKAQFTPSTCIHSLFFFTFQKKESKSSIKLHTGAILWKWTQNGTQKPARWVNMVQQFNRGFKINAVITRSSSDHVTQKTKFHFRKRRKRAERTAYCINSAPTGYEHNWIRQPRLQIGDPKSFWTFGLGDELQTAAAVKDKTVRIYNNKNNNYDMLFYTPVSSPSCHNC